MEGGAFLAEVVLPRELVAGCLPELLKHHAVRDAVAGTLDVVCLLDLRSQRQTKLGSDFQLMIQAARAGFLAGPCRWR
jgi:hypothetical protein